MFRPTVFDFLLRVRLHCFQMLACLVPYCWIWTCYLLPRVVTTVGLATQTRNFSASEFFLEAFRLPFIMFFFVFGTTRAGRELAASVCSERINRILLSNNFHSCLFSLCIQSYKSFSASAKYSDSVSISIWSYFTKICNEKFVLNIL